MHAATLIYPLVVVLQHLTLREGVVHTVAEIL